MPSRVPLDVPRRPSKIWCLSRGASDSKTPHYTAHGHRQLLLHRIKQYWPSFNLSFLWRRYCTSWKHRSSNKVPSKSAGSTAPSCNGRRGPPFPRRLLVWSTTPGTGERWPLPRLVYLCLGSVWVWSANGEKFDPLSERRDPISSIHRWCFYQRWSRCCCSAAAPPDPIIYCLLGFCLPGSPFSVVDG